MFIWNVEDIITDIVTLICIIFYLVLLYKNRGDKK